MKILTDLHHMDLYYSLQLLFENRLGYELYRPIGMDWKAMGYWAIHGGEDEVAECYLSEVDGRCKELLSPYISLEGKPWAVYGLHLPRIGKIEKIEDGIYSIEDRSKENVFQKGITLDKFIHTEFDILLASTPAQFEVFKKLKDLYQSKAKLILQMGNNWPIPIDANNLMLAFPYKESDNKHRVIYHQEFDLSVFNYRVPNGTNKINAYVYFPESELLMGKISKYLPSLEFNFIGNINGPFKDMILSSKELSSTISNSLFTWIIKPGGEGYGHILFNSFACGRPVIIRRSDYIGCAGDKLLEDGKTCIFIDNKSPTVLAAAIKYYLEPSRYTTMCQNTYNRFKEVVDFDMEERQIRRFLGALL